MIKLTVALLTSLGFAFGAFAQDSKEATLAQEDAGLMRQMAQSDLAEVQAGKVGAQKASSDELSEASDLAKKKNMQLPSQPMKKHQDAMKKLEQASGAQFHKAFMQQMVKDHQDALKLAQNAAKKAKDKDLKAAAEKAVPVIQNHLEMAKKIASSLK